MPCHIMSCHVCVFVFDMYLSKLWFCVHNCIEQLLMLIYNVFMPYLIYYHLHAHFVYMIYLVKHCVLRFRCKLYMKMCVHLITSVISVDTWSSDEQLFIV